MPKGIQPGAKLRLNRHGLPMGINSKDRGSFIVVIGVLIPKNLNQEQIKNLKKIQESLS